MKLDLTDITILVYLTQVFPKNYFGFVFVDTNYFILDFVISLSVSCVLVSIERYN